MRKRNVQLGRSRTSLYFTAPEHPCSMYMSISNNAYNDVSVALVT